jgi:hypothetical protein
MISISLRTATSGQAVGWVARIPNKLASDHKRRHLQIYFSPRNVRQHQAGHPMRQTLTCLVLVAALTGGAHAEHVTAEEAAIYNLQSQNAQEFAAQFKQFTDTELTDHVLKKLIVLASVAAFTVDMAEMNRARPTIHDPHHCNGDTCFEQWAYKVGENKWGLEKDGQVTKLVTTNISGDVETTTYCYGFNGIISCTADVANGHKLKRYRWFGLKQEGKGVIAQLYWADKADLIER